jgi:hypothetical protein
LILLASPDLYLFRKSNEYALKSTRKIPLAEMPLLATYSFSREKSRPIPALPEPKAGPKLPSPLLDTITSNLLYIVGCKPFIIPGVG